jgi:2-polyprenyl-3-methyl-5-hydroxy-6-metoxy-1,4-benzoquinol methylase
MDKTITVSYESGGGRASLVCLRDDKKDLFTKLFNCQLYGTVNVRGTLPKGITPYLIEDIHKFYLVSLKDKHSGDVEFGWMYKWDGSKMKDTVHELYFKKIIDDKFKADDVELTIYDKWSQEKIDEWQKGKYWFQTFDWALPETVRSDSNLIWNHMRHENYANKTVLDVGSNYGFYSFQASKLGAIVTGTEIKQSDIDMAEQIRHIEMTDCKFTINDSIPDQKYDFIFHLSVWHWPDPTYKDLPKLIEELKQKGKIIYLELINPPLIRTGLTIEDVDNIVGGEKLIHYKHKVRKTRTLYRLRGNL